MTCCCGQTSSSSVSLSSCCQHCLRLQFPELQFYGCPGFPFPSYDTIRAGNYRLFPNDTADCEVYSSFPDRYAADGTTEDGRLYFVAQQRESDGKRIVTAYLACTYEYGVTATPMSVATFACDDCPCTTIGEYTLESVTAEDSTHHAVWPATISIVDQSALTSPSGPPETITITLPDCRVAHAPSTVTADYAFGSQESNGDLVAYAWRGEFSRNAIGTTDTEVVVQTGCGYITLIFTDVTPLFGGGSDSIAGLLAIYPFPENGESVPIQLSACDGLAGSGLFACSCPTTSVFVSW